MFCLPLSGLVPAVGEDGLFGYSLLGEREGFMVTSHGGAGFSLLPKRRKNKEKLYIYTEKEVKNKIKEIRGLKKMNLALC